MELQINDYLTVETEAPLLEVHEFSYIWKLNRHGVLRIKGLLRPNAVCKAEELYESKVKLKEGENDSGRTLFNGCLTAIEMRVVGNVKSVSLEITSESCKLDQRRGSQSFQDAESNYEDVMRRVVEAGGGRVICTAGKTAIGKPLIRYQETEWEFAKRLASHLGTYVMADIITGRPNLWFGIRKGNEISSLQSEDYRVHIVRGKGGTDGKQTVYEVQSRELYQLGDTAAFWGKPAMVCQVRASYRQGELMYTYWLTRETVGPIAYQGQFTGLELPGIVEEATGEQVRIALDIDGGKSAGSYLYSWFPETGNAMYAMPEKGARIFLTFGNEDEREGFAVRCVPVKKSEKIDCRNRTLATKEGNALLLNEAEVSLSGKQQYRFLLSDQAISFTTPKKLRICAGKSIRLQAKDICVKTMDVVKVHQG